MNDHTPYLDARAVASLLVETEPYLSCDDCFDRIDEYVEHLVADPRHRDPAMDVHLAACGACAEEAATLVELLSDPRRAPGASD